LYKAQVYDLHHIVTAADLQSRYTDNAVVKFADGAYLIIPAANSHTRDDEVSRAKSWAANRQSSVKLCQVPRDRVPVPQTT